MKQYIRANRIFLGIIAIALLAALIVTGQRMSVEKADRQVDVILDYEEAELMAKQSDHDITWWLKEFDKMGVHKVALHEESLDTLTESDKPIKAELVTELRKDTYWMSQAPEEVLQMLSDYVQDDYDVMVIAESPEMFSFVKRAFEERYDPKRVHSVASENGGYLLIDGNVEDNLYGTTRVIATSESVGFAELHEMESSRIMYLNLGLLPEKVSIIQNAGCSVEPRTASYEDWNDRRFLEDVTAQYQALGVTPHYWIMADKVVPGYDRESARQIVDYLNDNHITIGIVENTNQRENMDPDGLEDVIEDTDFNVVRIFSVWPYIQFRYEYYGYDSYQEIENSLFRAVVERNIKVIYYKPMKEKDDNYTYITDVKDYRDSFQSLSARLARHGITLGEASPSRPYRVPWLLQVLIALGAGCATLLCLRSVFPISQKWMFRLLILGAVGVVAAYFIMPNMSALLTSMVAAVALPCLAVWWVIFQGVNYQRQLSREEKVGKLMTRGIAVLVVGILIAMVGSVMTAAPISSIQYMLELEIFRGVKITQLLPLAFFALLFFLVGHSLWGEKKKTTLEWRDVHWLLNYQIKVWPIALAGVLYFVGTIYLARTGHETSVGASTAELIVRNFLEEVLYARPRTKEFLIAFPAVMLFVYSMVREWKIASFLFGMVSVIGFTSVVNTFMHIRTPMELGFARTAYSVLFGILFGLLYVLVLELCYRLYGKWRERRHA